MNKNKKINNGTKRQAVGETPLPLVQQGRDIIANFQATAENIDLPFDNTDGVILRLNLVDGGQVKYVMHGNGGSQGQRIGGIAKELNLKSLRLLEYFPDAALLEVRDVESNKSKNYSVDNLAVAQGGKSIGIQLKASQILDHGGRDLVTPVTALQELREGETLSVTLTTSRLRLQPSQIGGFEGPASYNGGKNEIALGGFDPATFEPGVPDVIVAGPTVPSTFEPGAPTGTLFPDAVATTGFGFFRPAPPAVAGRNPCFILLGVTKDGVRNEMVREVKSISYNSNGGVMLVLADPGRSGPFGKELKSGTYKKLKVDYLAPLTRKTAAVVALARAAIKAGPDRALLEAAGITWSTLGFVEEPWVGGTGGAVTGEELPGRARPGHGPIAGTGAGPIGGPIAIIGVLGAGAGVALPNLEGPAKMAGHIPLAKAVVKAVDSVEDLKEGTKKLKVAWKAEEGQSAYLHLVEGDRLYKIGYSNFMDELGMLAQEIEMPGLVLRPIGLEASIDVNGVSYRGQMVNIKKSSKSSGVWVGVIIVDVFTWDDMKEEMDESGRIRGNLCWEIGGE
jgi:hypothetical protein